MATGDALEVGIAVPMQNGRAARDSDGDGVPDNWVVTGSPTVSWRVASGGQAAWGLSALGGLYLELGASDSVALQSYDYATPYDSSFGGEWSFWGMKPGGSDGNGWTLKSRYLDADGNQVALSTTTGGTSYDDQEWRFRSQSVNVFSPSSLKTVELQFTRNTGTTGFVIDPPVFVWNPTGAAGFRTMSSVPAISGSFLSPFALGRNSRDARSGIYYADPYGATPKWRLSLNYEICSEADYGYWRTCYAVNRGASGFRDTLGRRLGPQPVAVRHYFWDVADLDLGNANSFFSASGKPQTIVGNITKMNLATREHVGWGYAGTVEIEEA